MSQSIASVMDRIEAEQATVISIGPNATSLDLLQAVYRNPALPLPTRIRAAGLALPHEHPRLMVQAQVNDQDFATLLDRAIERSFPSSGMAKVIEAKPVPQIEAKPPMPRLTDRRYRRI